MKLNRITQGLLALGLASATTAAIASTPFSTAITPGPEHKQIQLNIGFLNKDSAKVGRYYGQTDKGFEPGLNINYLSKEVDSGHFSHTLIKGAGTDNLYLRNRTGKQGDFAVGIEYRQRTLSQEKGLHLPYLNYNGQVVRDRAWDISHEREKLLVSGQKVLGDNWKVNFSLNREDKQGNRLQGYGFWDTREGFMFAAPIMQRTDQFELGAEYRQDKWQARVTYHFAKFEQLEDNSFEKRNLMNGSLGTPETFSLAPENTYQRLVLQGAYALSSATRISAEADYGIAKQNDAFVQDSNDTYNLGVIGNSLDAKYTTTRAALRASHRLTPGVMLRASYRFDDRDNSTDKYQNLVREFGSQTRDTRTHSWTRHTADADANIRLPMRSNLLIGAKFEDTDRKQGARGETQEGTFHARIRSQLGTNLTGGVKASYGQLTGNNYEEKYLLDNTDAMRTYHLASVDKTLITANTSWNGLEQLALGLEVTYKNFDYKKSSVGLLEDNRLAATLTADYFPSNTLSGYAFFTYEDGERTQGGRANVITGELTTLSFGVGGKYQITGDGRYSVGTDILLVHSTNTPKASQGADFNDYKSELTQIRVYGDYNYSPALGFRLSYLAHQYLESGYEFNPLNYKDAQIPKYDETVHLVVGSATYRF